MVIMFINAKGGVGKTTLATLLASTLIGKGHRTLLVDFDRQRSAAKFATRHHVKIPTTEGAGKMALLRKWPEITSGYEHVICDMPPHIDEHDAIKLADKILVPVLPGQFDLDAIGELKGLNKKDWLFVANRVSRTRLSKDLIEVLGQSGKLARTQIKDRVAYATWALGGPLPRDAELDIEALLEEIGCL